MILFSCAGARPMRIAGAVTSWRSRHMPLMLSCCFGNIASAIFKREAEKPAAD